MLIIHNHQFEVLESAVLEKFIVKLQELITKEFASVNPAISGNPQTLSAFIERNISAALDYKLTKEDSICGFVVLSLLNGEGFLTTKPFAVYHYYLKGKLYDPNKYIFEIPDLSKKK